MDALGAFAFHFAPPHIVKILGAFIVRNKSYN
jgi:hypothetical protein